MKYIALAAMLGLFASACATTEGATQARADAAASQAVASAEDLARAEREGYDPYAIRCERQTVLGSRLPARQVCRPEWEWRAMQETSQDAVRHVQSQGTPMNSN
ncbi:MAG: hypothetical protein GC187_08840 [Alphaproteobacteria bacterium]|nr:hypothetical protein [Alphaproteobacteria bacterium]